MKVLSFLFKRAQAVDITYEYAQILGASVFQAYKGLASVHPGPLSARSESVELDVPHVSAEQVEEARKILATTKNDFGANFMKYGVVRITRRFRLNCIGSVSQTRRRKSLPAGSAAGALNATAAANPKASRNLRDIMEGWC